MKILPKILLVEDDPQDIELTIESLGEIQLANTIELARDGEEALDYLYCRGGFAGRTTGAPVVILLDLKMPRMGGLEFLNAIRSDPKMRRIPVAVITSSREEYDYIRTEELGAMAYISKPFHIDKFMDTMTQLDIVCIPIDETGELELINAF